MANTVTFNLVEMNDYQDALTLEGVYQKYASVAGVQKFKFDNSISGFSSSHWTTISNISYSGGNLVATGSIGTETIAWYDTNMPHSYSIEVFAHTGTWGFVLRGDGSGNYYKITYNGTVIKLDKVVDS